jgi:cell division protein FtsW
VLFGIAMIYSASYYKAYTETSGSAAGANTFIYMRQQSVAALLGLAGMIAAASIDYHKTVNRLTSAAAYIAACATLVWARLGFQPVNGAYRWVTIPIINVSFQPSELAKVAVTMCMALYISRDTSRPHTVRGIIGCALITAIPAGLVFWGKSFSMTLMVCIIAFAIYLVSSAYFWRALALAGGAAGAAAAVMASGSDFRAGRISIWLNPFSDPQGLGYQTIQSLYSVASGGLFGLGIGQSNQKLLFMPEPHNDFIFSVICEELGFFGAAVVLLLFGILIWRGAVAAFRAPDLFGTLLATGAVIMVGAQVVINVAVVTNTIPNTGVPLPFISYGGTSIVFAMILMGILLNVSRQSRKRE